MKSSHTHTHTHAYAHTHAGAILRPGGSCPRTQCGYYHQQCQCTGKTLAVPRHGPFLLFTANLCKWGEPKNARRRVLRIDQNSGYVGL